MWLDWCIRVSRETGDLVKGANAQVGRGEIPWPAGLHAEDAEGRLKDAGPQHRGSEGRSVQGGLEVVSQDFCIPSVRDPGGLGGRSKASLRCAEERA